jgi:ATP-binding cassette subfamily B protein
MRAVGASNRLRSIGELEAALWPPARAGEAIRALGRRIGVPGASGNCATPPPDATPDEMNRWIAAAAQYEGLHGEQVFPSFVDSARVIASRAPALVQVSTPERAGYLAVAAGTGGTVTIIRPDLTAARAPLHLVAAAIQQAIEGTHGPNLDQLLTHAGIRAGRRAPARTALLSERFRETRLGGCWCLRAPASEQLGEAVRQAGIVSGVWRLLGVHAIQAALFVGAWWLLGRGLLEGRLDRGWLLGWLLLLMSLVPFRLAASWLQGLLAISAGATLRRRLLEGALRIDRQEIKSKGAGQFFGLISESSAVEALALSGGLAALLALIEILVAAAVFSASGAWHATLLLIAWVVWVGWLAHRYLASRRRWTDRRLGITERLIEHMVGHRTRLVQQPSSQRHTADDDALEPYLEDGLSMDRWELRLLAIAPRGWMAVAIGAMAPSAVTGATAGQLAVSVGGMLLAYRAFRRLAAGLADAAGAGVAATLVAPLARAAARRENPTSPAAAIPLRSSQAPEGVAALARDVEFRYRTGGQPALQGCSLRITRGTRVLLEGPSGSGKTTLASMFAGLASPDSGLLLVDGLDRGVLGAAGWRARVVMAPQPHDNYLVSGSLALNLLMGRQWPARPNDLADAEDVCRELGLGDLLARMPAGLHQTVGETGWQLSQGERTRVFLARAVLQQPDLLILDECFSALDPENVERAVRCITQRASTVLAVAHT